jgi:DNA-binding HxlR family transcriptional regulator
VVSRRQYGQFCPLAKALDILGERWTLLIVRELLVGPRRYTDLRDALPGLATDLLAARLRDLQGAGVLDRREVPPPTPATVYQLTERGVALRPVIRELSLWGRPLLAEPGDDHVPDSALLLGLEAAFRPERANGFDVVFALDVSGRQVTVRVHDRTVWVIPGGPDDTVSLRIVTDRRGFIDLARGHLSDRVHIHGDRQAVARLQRVFSLT